MKKGDRVVCIKNGNDIHVFDITIGKSYIVIDFIDRNKDGIFTPVIMNDEGFKDWYPIKWFKLLSEVRNEKLKRLEQL